MTYWIFRKNNNVVACWRKFLILFCVIAFSCSFFLASWKNDFATENNVNSVHIRGLKNEPTSEASSDSINELVAHLHRSKSRNDTLAEIMAFKEMEIDDDYLKKLQNDPELLQKWMVKREKEFKRRRHRIKSVCKRYNIGRVPLSENTTYLPRTLYPDYEEDPPVESPDPNSFSVTSGSYQAMACLINKVASSSLATAFLTIAGYGPEFTSPHSMLGLIKPKTPEEFEYANSTFLKFMFVRHPMERLLSCYRDKMVTSPHWSLPAFRRHVRNMSRRIISARQLIAQGLPYPPIEERLLSSNKSRNVEKKTVASENRGKAKKQSIGDRRLLSQDYEEAVKIGHELVRNDLNKITDDVNDVDSKEEEDDQEEEEEVEQPTTKQQPQVVTPLDDVPPTFAEFLEYILATDLQGHGYDSHWVPYWRHCTPCHVPYHVIGKLETAKEDFIYVWKKTGLDAAIPIPFINGKKKFDSERHLDLETQYYSSLPRDLILRVFRRFRLDFEMFEYGINEVLQKGGHSLMTEEEFLSP